MKRKLRVEIYLNKKKEYCFRIVAGNNKVVAVGESYKKKQSLLKTVHLLEGNNFWDYKDLTD